MADSWLGARRDAALPPPEIERALQNPSFPALFSSPALASAVPAAPV